MEDDGATANQAEQQQQSTEHYAYGGSDSGDGSWSSCRSWQSHPQDSRLDKLENQFGMLQEQLGMIASQLTHVVQQHPQVPAPQTPVAAAEHQVPGPQTPVVAHPEHPSLEAAHESELALAMTGKPLQPQAPAQPPQQPLTPSDVYVQQSPPPASQSRHRADSGSRSPVPSDDESLAALQPAPTKHATTKLGSTVCANRPFQQRRKGTASS